MKNKTQNILICILICVVAALGIYIFLIKARMNSNGISLTPSVPDDMAAVSIAQLVCKSYTDIDVEAEAFVAEYDAENDIWKVRIKNERDFDGSDVSCFDGDDVICIEGGDATILKASVNVNSVKKYYKLKALYE